MFMARCFIGIIVPESIKSSIIQIQKQLKTLPIVAKFVEPENLHLSLSFLGEVNEMEIERTGNILDLICSKYREFEVDLLGIKLIPNESYVRVIALDVKQEISLEKITKEVKEKIGGDVKPPHLTLCRVKNIDKKAIPEIKKIKVNIRLPVTSVYLIKSTLQKTGPIYTIIHESKLSCG